MIDNQLQKKLTKWHETDQYDKIIKTIEALPQEEWDYSLVGQLARAYNNRGEGTDYDRAFELLSSVREQGENDSVWHFRMGYAHYYADREAMAALCFERALELNPDEEDAQELLDSCREILSEEESGDGEEEVGIPQMYEKEEVEALDAHVEQYFGKCESVFHEIFSPDIHVDILIIAPTPEKNYYTLMTQGMGAHRMSVPEELAEYKLERAELLICLPPDWNLKDSGQEQWYWPMRWLKILARLPGEHDSWLGWGHTVPCGEPLAENTDLCCMLLIGPEDTEDEANVCVMPDGSEVNFYQIFPLYEEEMNFKLEHDTEELLKRMEETSQMEETSHIVDVSRPNCCEGFVSERAGTVLEVELEAQIKPFFWVAQEKGASVCLDAGTYLQEVFDSRADEGFEGNGYDWGSLAQVFLDERRPDLADAIGFDPEAGMFCAYASDTAALREFIRSFKEACEDRAGILDLFSRAELD